MLQEFNTGTTYLTAPSDFQLSFSLAVIDGNGDYHYLDKKHPSFMREYSPDPTATSERGRPLYYADFDKDFLQALIMDLLLLLLLFQIKTYNVNFIILYKPSSLTDHNSGTWISQNARNALLIWMFSRSLHFYER